MKLVDKLVCKVFGHVKVWNVWGGRKFAHQTCLRCKTMWPGIALNSWFTPEKKDIPKNCSAKIYRSGMEEARDIMIQGGRIIASYNGRKHGEEPDFDFDFNDPEQSILIKSIRTDLY